MTQLKKGEDMNENRIRIKISGNDTEMYLNKY